MSLGFKKGSTDVIRYFFAVQDNGEANPGEAKTGLAWDDGGAIASYNLPGAARQPITLATQTVTGAHSDGGFVEQDATNMKGLYRFDPPDAAYTGADYNNIQLVFPGAVLRPITDAIPTNTPLDVFTIVNSAIFGMAQLEKMLIAVQGSVNDVGPAVGDFDTTLTQATGFWNGRSVMFIDGPAKGDVAIIDETGGYVSTNGHMIFTTPFKVAPGDGDNFIIPNQSIDVNVLRWLGALLTAPTVGGVPEVDVTHQGGGAIPAPGVTGVPDVNPTHWADGEIPAQGITGVPEIDMTHIAAGLVPVPTTDGVPDVNVERWIDTLVTLSAGVPDMNVQSSDDIDLSATQKASVETAADAALATVGVTSVRMTKLDNSPEGVKKNTALNNFGFIMRDDTTEDPKAGLTVIPTRSIDGAAFAATTNSVAEIASGAYKINLSASDLNGDVIILKFTEGTAKDTIITIITNA